MKLFSVIQNRWLSQSFKETALATAVWSVLKAKRKLLKYPDGFITRFYSITEYLVPVFAWGFFGTNQELNKSCVFLKVGIFVLLIPEDPANMPRNHISPKLFSEDLVPGNSCKIIVKKNHMITTP